jgi:hypothetical protein
MRPETETRMSATHENIIFEVGEVKGGLRAMNERMGRMERSLDKGLAEIKLEVRGVSAAVISTTAPLDERITTLELKASERRGERKVWLWLSSLLGTAVGAGGDWIITHLPK